MDGRELRQKITELIKKYRYAALVLFAGLFLMLLPQGSTESAAESPPAETVAKPEEADYETRLAEVLSQIEGAGRVKVFLSQSAGEEILYQTDEDIASGDIRRETVILSGSDRAESGLIRQVNPPVYQGAIILCQGADSAAIRLSITQAVANTTGLGADQISVLKMK